MKKFHQLEDVENEENSGTCHADSGKRTSDILDIVDELAPSTKQVPPQPSSNNLEDPTAL